MLKRIPRIQKNNSSSLKDYDTRICVCCDFSFRDKIYFHDKMCEVTEDILSDIIFIGSSKSTGGESFLNLWCQKYNYPIHYIDPNWAKYEASDQSSSVVTKAAFDRNYEIVDVVTHLIVFHDTNLSARQSMKHLIELAMDPDTKIIIRNYNPSKR